MEKVLVQKWYENKDRLENQLQLLLPEKEWYARTKDYADFAKLVLYTILQPEENMQGCLFDISKSYSGDLAIVFLYNHCLYASIISYGSCSGCDSLGHACSCCWWDNR